MPDVDAAIADVDRALQEGLAEILELRAADPQQRAIVDAYVTRLDLVPPARVLEIGCGTGPVTRVLASLPSVAQAGAELAAALKSEATRRVQANEFFGFMSFVSFLARKPDSV